jgi:hypothetical protein
MAEHVKGYRNPGDIEIKTLKFVSIAGQIIDIGPIVVEMNIFQNLFEHYLQCEIVLNDSLGIIQTLGNGRSDENGGFTGGELLFISLLYMKCLRGFVLKKRVKHMLCLV